MATIKQKIAYKEVVKGSTISSAMVKAGYSPKTAKRTNKLLRTKGWQELTDKYISEEALMKVHKEGLSAYKSERVGEQSLEVPDFSTRHKYLETGYKVRGRMKDNEARGNTYNTIIFAEEQQRAIARRLLDGKGTSEETPDRLYDSNEPKV